MNVAEVVSATLGWNADEFEQRMAKSLEQSGYQKASFMSCEPEPQSDSDKTPIQQGELNQEPEIGQSWDRNQWERDMQSEQREISSYKIEIIDDYLRELDKTKEEFLADMEKIKKHEIQDEYKPLRDQVAAFERAALWIRWLNYLLSYAVLEFASHPGDLTTSTHSNPTIKKEQELEENLRKENYKR